MKTLFKNFALVTVIFMTIGCGDSTLRGEGQEELSSLPAGERSLEAAPTQILEIERSSMKTGDICPEDAFVISQGDRKVCVKVHTSKGVFTCLDANLLECLEDGAVQLRDSSCDLPHPTSPFDNGTD